jgi:hypothetical protein
MNIKKYSIFYTLFVKHFNLFLIATRKNCILFRKKTNILRGGGIFYAGKH